MKPRKHEYLWIALVIALTIVYMRLESTDVSQQMIEEKRFQATPVLSHPLPYTATVTQMGRTRYYVPPARERNF